MWITKVVHIHTNTHNRREMNMSKGTSTFPAWLNQDTGSIIPSNKENMGFGSRRGFVLIEAAIDPEKGIFYDVNGEDNVSTVVDSASIERITRALENAENQRVRLLAAAAKLPNGLNNLKSKGLYDPKVDDQKINEYEPSATLQTIEKIVKTVRKQDTELTAMKKVSSSRVKTKTSDDLAKLDL